MVAASAFSERSSGRFCPRWTSSSHFATLMRGAEVGAQPSSFSSPCDLPHARFVRYFSTDGSLQSRNARNDREDRLLRSRSLWKNDQPAHHLRQARSQKTRKEAVAGHQDRPEALLPPSDCLYRIDRRIQSPQRD